MDKKAMEARLHELKGKQSAIFNVKKAQRNVAELETIRTEMNELKAKAKAAYRAKN
jgi:hypothetical protein